MALKSHPLAYALLAISSRLIHASPTTPLSLPTVEAQHPIALSALPTPHSSFAFNWTAPPDRSSTHHLIFESASSLLQHWSNTVYPFGHSLVPSVIPLGTVMYHGRGREDPDVPVIPDWLSFDYEHAMLFAGGKNSTLLTFTPKRPLNVVYFDGNSGGNDRDGRFDTQYLLDKGDIVYEGWDVMDDFERAARLCEWAKPLSIDGFIRMEFDFEAIICDFHHTLTITSSVPNIPTRGFNETDLPTRKDQSAAFTPILALVSDRYNYYPGLPYVIPDYTRFISLFDTTLAPSLIPLRQNTARKAYRLLGMSRNEAVSVRARLEEVMRDRSERSGVHWEGVLRAVKNLYAERLGKVKRTLSLALTSSTSSRRARGGQASVMRQLLLMLAPYIGLDVPPPTSYNSDSDIIYNSDSDIILDWAVPIFERCATSLTSDLAESESRIRMTREELVLLDAIEGVIRQICRVTVKSWATLKVSSQPADAKVLLQIGNDVDALVEWLGWAEWSECVGGCDEDHFCWTPEWMGPFEPIEKVEPYCFEREPEIDELDI